jgi:hypothetical protein
MSSSRSPSAVKAGSELLQRYRNEKGRGEGVELHNILFGGSPERGEEGSFIEQPPSPYNASAAMNQVSFCFSCFILYERMASCTADS